MSDCIHKYPEIVLPWDAYPRAHYFRGRFLDLNKRFTRITGALPKVLHDAEMMDHFEELNKLLANRYIHITVYGEDDIDYKDLYVGNPEDINMISESKSSSSCLNLIICFATIDSLDDHEIHQIMKVIVFASKELADSLLIVCKTQESFPESEITAFRAELQRHVHTTIRGFSTKFEIQVSEISDIKGHISAIYERQIVQALSRIYSYLGIFVTSNTKRVQNKTSVLTDMYVHRQLKDYISNRFTISDIKKATFLTQLVVQLARVVKCTIISPISSKYGLPSWVCNRLLHEIQYEDALIQSVSTKSVYNIGQLERFSKPYKLSMKTVQGNKLLRGSKLSKCFPLDIFVKSIQNDFTSATAKAEKVLFSMGSLTNVMRKMMFEIKGYFKQTIINDVFMLQTASNMNIPDDLRQEILLIRGVYGMGTLYEQLEIHVEEHNEARITEIMDTLRRLTKKHQFPYAYTIKYIKQ